MTEAEWRVNTLEDPPLWTPIFNSEEQIYEFMKFVNSMEKATPTAEHSFNCDYFQFYDWSVRNINQFWLYFLEFSKIKISNKPVKAIDETVAINSHPTWFPMAEVCYAENLLKPLNYWAERIAVYGVVEGPRRIRTKTYAQLNDDVLSLARALKASGVSPGDRVAAFMPNCIESLTAMLATNYLGAVWCSTSTDFGVPAAADRLGQLEPKVLFSVTGTFYRGKCHECLSKLQSLVEKLGPCLQKVVLVPFFEMYDHEPYKVANEAGQDWLKDKLNMIAQDTDLDKAMESVGEKAQKAFGSLGCSLAEFIKLGLDQDQELAPYRQDFNAPSFVLFSSGTTGKPKCIVHSGGGTLIKHLQEHRLQCDLGPSDRLLFFTTTGWMMWNWLVSALASSCSIVLYEGDTLQPEMWPLVDQLKVTVFGVSAKWLAEQHVRFLANNSPLCNDPPKFESLRAILSTGSPLAPSSFQFVYEQVKGNLLLGSISGGTDMIGCCVACSTILPVYCGQLQCCVLGMAVESWQPGRRENIMDKPGDLIITKPFPSMPVMFWNDTQGNSFQAAYFEVNEGVWTHGDFIGISSKTRGVTILGRSDGTLNPNGVRFGSAEIYNALSHLDWIVDSLCVAQSNQARNEERVMLFVKLREPSADAAGQLKKLDDKLVTQIATAIRQDLSARHVPALMFEITDIPYTVNMKKVEVPIRRLLEGMSKQAAFANRDSLSNPQVVEMYEQFVDQLRW